MSDLELRKSIAHLEMDDNAKRIRKALMDIAPDVGVSKNDLFNNGFGGMVSIIMFSFFGVTFLYYAYTNSVYNKTAKFLVPANGGVIAGSMLCSYVPLTLSHSFALDSNGLWNSNTNFSLGDSLYGLELINAQYENQAAYEEGIGKFVDDLFDKSNNAYENDYAWNIVFGGSYAVEASTGEGKASLFVDADSRIMYDVSIYSYAISSINGSCIPEMSSMEYDGTNFVFSASLNESSLFCPQLSPNQFLPESLGLSSKFPSVALKLDAATITTAIAINYHIAALDTLTRVPSLDVYPYLTAYIDSSYAPMQPVYCFDPNMFGYFPMFSALCLVKLGDVYAWPITSHYGQSTGYFEGDDDTNSGTYSYLPDTCDCDIIDYQPDCQHYDIDIGLVFNPDDDLVDMLISVLVMQEIAEIYNVTIKQLVRPMLASSVQASYYLKPGEDLTRSDALDSLYDSFVFCSSCYVLSIELYDKDHYDFGTTINKGSRIISDMACTNVFYDDAVLETMIVTPPSDITEQYLVCTDSLSTAVSTGISNAYASAGLYTSVVLFVLMILIDKYQQVFKKPRLNSVEEQEVLVRNAIVDVLEYVLKDSCRNEDKAYLAKKLEIIGITDPLTHAERPLFGQAGLTANKSAKSSSDDSREAPSAYETIYQEKDIPIVEMPSLPTVSEV